VDEEKQEKHWVQSWFSFGDLTSLVVMLVVFVGGYAQLRRDVQVLQRDMTEMKSVQITPGAATRISSLETSIGFMQRAAEEDRRQSAEFRADMRAQMARIETAIQRRESAR
jgi:hypothetical protein